MSTEQEARSNPTSAASAPAKPSWGTKAGYIGTGVLLGLVIYPFVRKGLSKIQPKVDRILDEITGKAEGLAEKASDLMAKARESLGREEPADHDHDHGSEPGDGHAHDHDPGTQSDRPRPRRTVKDSVG